ncbi:hypothetical protein BGZ70_006384 [Mortierella alpina]|uniref:Glucosidase 2 subunit beta n=1 Tax=Mortierella alpina TaxID=64518 RepID=A0A9P6J7R3_MORAP|nr:hypothetical protein BGZ70_006384 [Mortierella alpina]
MKSRHAYIPLFASLAISVAITHVGGSSIPRGVPPSDAKLYTPSNTQTWSCLDGSKTITFSAVNDDYCDCADGSDEPGTSACGTGYFYCENVGHLPSSIKTSRVNDGVCEPECCDGTDEYDGQVQCPNVCEEVGREARKERERVQAIQEQGSRLRKEYIQHGKTAKLKLQQELETLQGKIDQIQKTASEAKEKLDEATEVQEKFLEGSKSKREETRRLQLKPLIEEQTRRLQHSRDSRDRLRKTLQDLKENHNKNYHDLAVKNTVSGFDEYVSGLDESATAEESAEDSDNTSHDNHNSNDSCATGECADQELTRLSDETFAIQREIVTLRDLLMGLKHEYNTEYNDEAVLAAVKIAEEFDLLWNEDRQEFKDELPLDIPVEESDASPESEKLREATDLAQAEYDKTSEEETQTRDTIREIERKLDIDLGDDETFAQLLDQCFEFKDIEYTYSICLFGDANQRSHSTTFLGKFSSWEGENHNVQMYTGGTRCWNGPDRSVKLVMTCGIENEIISVTEPAKCEYLFKMQTPAACPVLVDANDDGHGQDSSDENSNASETESESVREAAVEPEQAKDDNTRHDEL